MSEYKIDANVTLAQIIALKASEIKHGDMTYYFLPMYFSITPGDSQGRLTAHPLDNLPQDLTDEINTRRAPSSKISRNGTRPEDYGYSES